MLNAAGPKILKVVSYARVSTLLGQNPEAQLINIREYCKLKGYLLVEEFVDLGISGTKEKRPALDNMLLKVKNKEFDAVIVSGLDRISRSTKHFLNLLDFLETNNVSLISLRENLDFTSSTGRMVASVLASVATLEAELCRERIRSALRARKILAEQTNNGWRCGRKPLPVEITVQVLELHKCGASIRAIAKKLSIGKTSIERILNRNKSGLAGTGSQSQPDCPIK